MGKVLGVDPGQSGALVLLDGPTALQVERMPATPKVGVDLAQVRDWLETWRPDFVVLERAQSGAFGRSRGALAPAALGAYMRDYGGILGILCALRLPHETVHPATWHRSVCGKREGDPKARALEVVRQRLPTLQVVPPRCRVPHDGIVDAACLALWGQAR